MPRGAAGVFGSVWGTRLCLVAAAATPGVAGDSAFPHGRGAAGAFGGLRFASSLLRLRWAQPGTRLRLVAWQLAHLGDSATPRRRCGCAGRGQGLGFASWRGWRRRGRRATRCAVGAIARPPSRRRRSVAPSDAVARPPPHSVADAAWRGRSHLGLGFASSALRLRRARPEMDSASPRCVAGSSLPCGCFGFAGAARASWGNRLCFVAAPALPAEMARV